MNPLTVTFEFVQLDVQWFDLPLFIHNTGAWGHNILPY